MSSEPVNDSYFESMMKVPCLRKSLLYGISGGLGAGLLRFVLTSNAKKSSNFGFVSYLGITVLTWSYCRYTNASMEKQNKMLATGIEKIILNEGTEPKNTETNKIQLNDA